jgi:hypothetical protein
LFVVPVFYSLIAAQHRRSQVEEELETLGPVATDGALTPAMVPATSLAGGGH